MQGRQSTGAILHHHRVDHDSWALVFIKAEADSLIRQVLEGDVSGSALFGRGNAIRTLQQSKMAEILEILPVMHNRSDQSLGVG